jgi:hypothetical protein
LFLSFSKKEPKMGAYIASGIEMLDSISKIMARPQGRIMGIAALASLASNDQDTLMGIQRAEDLLASWMRDDGVAEGYESVQEAMLVLKGLIALPGLRYRQGRGR